MRLWASCLPPFWPRDVCVIENLPDISDGGGEPEDPQRSWRQIRNDQPQHLRDRYTTHLTGTNVPDDLSRQMRASYYFLGALLSRFGKAEVAMPGGCNLGPAPSTST